MNFDAFSVHDRIQLTQNEFIRIIRDLFNYPHQLKEMVGQKVLTRAQSRAIMKGIEQLNAKKCACCRVFDQARLSLHPINEAFEPLLDIAQANVRGKYY